MASVYRARDTRLGREVAVKVPGEHHAGSAEFVERFEREIESVASLDHPNIVRVFDSGKDGDGSPYMAMELVDGGTLRDRIRHSGPLPPREAARVVLRVADALGAAHAAGIVHRDVKPENVLLTKDGDAKVADFGIARAADATAMTRTSMILGTAPYLSPEQARGESVGPASDLYSLGVVLYEALTGRTPFGTGEHVNPLAIAMRHCTEPAPSPRACNQDVPRPLELVTLTLMRKRPAERYADAAALADDLGAFLRDETLSSTTAIRLASSPEGVGTQALRRAPSDAPAPRRRREAVWVMTVAFAGVLALAFSPLVPMQGPAALVGGAVVPDAGGGLDRAVGPTLQGHPGVPKQADGERAEGPRPGGEDPGPPGTPANPAAPAAAEEAGPGAPSDPSEEIAPASATAGASAIASASASAAASVAPSAAASGPRPARFPPASVRRSPGAEPSETSAVFPELPGAERAAKPQSAPTEEPRRDRPVAVEPPEVRIPNVDVPDF
jgi:serine/threonine-protein kinase